MKALTPKEERRYRALLALWHECQDRRIGFMQDLGNWGCYERYLVKAGYIRRTGQPEWAKKAGLRGWQKFEITDKGIRGIQKQHGKVVK